MFVASSEQELLKPPKGKKHCRLWELETTREPQSHEISSSYKLASVWVGSIAVKGSEDEKGQKTSECKV